MSSRRIDPALVTDRTRALRSALAASDFDALIVTSPANVDYASGYRSLGSAVHGLPAIAVIFTAEEFHLAGPVADSAPAFDAGIDEAAFHAYGRFYFESPHNAARATQLVDQHSDLAAAVATAATRLLPVTARVGMDDTSLASAIPAAVTEALPGVVVESATSWLSGVRGCKLPGEVDLIERCARITEQAILDGISQIAPGRTEAQIAHAVAGSMAVAGVSPRFVVVTAGERSALADAYPTDRVIQPGDLIRFDVGGQLDGYWSDLGRTAVLGPPSARQLSLYSGIRAGVDRQLARIRPGISARDLFDLAIRTVEEQGGPTPYRRQHCGHAIGLDVYEPPIINPGTDLALETGMTFCLETPYYEVGWGGMMVEDTIVVEPDGPRMLSDRGRDLIEVAL